MRFQQHCKAMMVSEKPYPMLRQIYWDCLTPSFQWSLGRASQWGRTRPELFPGQVCLLPHPCVSCGWVWGARCIPGGGPSASDFDANPRGRLFGGASWKKVLHKNRDSRAILRELHAHRDGLPQLLKYLVNPRAVKGGGEICSIRHGLFF